jgi:hypothetical protein
MIDDRRRAKSDGRTEGVVFRAVAVSRDESIEEISEESKAEIPEELPVVLDSTDERRRWVGEGGRGRGHDSQNG